MRSAIPSRSCEATIRAGPPVLRERVDEDSSAGGSPVVSSLTFLRAASLDEEKLRNTAADLDCNTFYVRFRIDSRTGIQTGHRVLLIRWQGDHKVMLPPRPG